MTKIKKLFFVKMVQLWCTVAGMIFIYLNLNDIFVPFTVILLVLGMIYDLFLIVYVLRLKSKKDNEDQSS